ncbi:MAG: hypothetical protein ISP10_09070 [Aeromicrobium sp.]|nr:hypothetical protein [Aeromicrobium sp.]
MTRTDTTRLYLRVSALVLGIALIAAPAVASASPWRGIGVTLHDLGLDKTPTLVVFGSLDDDLERPATVELPIPAGSRIGWVGEVFGGDPSLDPDDAQRERTPAGVLYSVETTPVAAGQTLTLDAVIVAGADPLVPSAEPTEAVVPGGVPAEDQAPSSSGPPLLLLVTGGGLLIAVGALIVLVNRSRSKD